MTVWLKREKMKPQAVFFRASGDGRKLAETFCVYKFLIL